MLHAAHLESDGVCLALCNVALPCPCLPTCLQRPFKMHTNSVCIILLLLQNHRRTAKAKNGAQRTHRRTPMEPLVIPIRKMPSWEGSHCEISGTFLKHCAFGDGSCAFGDGPCAFFMCHTKTLPWRCLGLFRGCGDCTVHLKF